MADLSLRYLLYGEDKTASKSIKGVGAQASSTASLVSGGLGKIGSMLGGEVGDMLNRVSAGFDTIGGKAKGMGAKLTVGGSAMMGLGLAMQAMASKDIESMKQLDAAVEATGKGYDGFGADVDRLIAKQVAFGHTDGEVTASLRVLTTAYNDPKKALQEMTLVTDLAAAKHITLADAAGLVAKAHGGAGRVFKEFGITVGTTAAGTKDYDGALTALSGKLKGQASASMDSFGGKVTQVKTWLDNQATALSEKYGPAVTIAGGAVTALGSVMQVMAARAAAAALAQDATAVSATRMSRAVSMAGSGLKMMAGPLAIGAIALGYFAKQSMDSSARVDELSQTLDAQTGAITSNTRAWAAKNLSDSGALGEANRLGISVTDVTDAVLGNGAALARVTATVDAYTASLPDNRKGMLQAAQTHHLLSNAISGGNDELNRGIDKTKLQAAATKESTTATADAVDPVKSLKDAQKYLADETKGASDAINSYNQALQDAGLKVLSTRDASRNLKQAVADVDEAVKKNGRTLSENTQKGRDNAAALDAQAGKALSLSKSILDETGSEDKMRASLLRSRESLVASGIKFGMTRAEAEKYADSVLKIPDKKHTDAVLDAAKANAALTALRIKITGLPNGVINVSTHGYAQTYQYLKSLQAAMRGINNTPVRIATGAGGQGGITVRAGGGPVLAGMPYIVGDGGRPELFVPDTNGTILPRVPGTSHAAASVGSSGGSSQPLVVQMVLDGRVLHQSLLALKRTKGGGLALG